eukprot:1737236-Heterocapsa_arctica.AAC.1
MTYIPVYTWGDQTGRPQWGTTLGDHIGKPRCTLGDDTGRPSARQICGAGDVNSARKYVSMPQVL